MFHFYSLSLHFSLHNFPFSLINVVITVLFIVLCFFGGWEWGNLFFSTGVVKIEGFVFLFFVFLVCFLIPNFSPAMSHAK